MPSFIKETVDNREPSLADQLCAAIQILTDTKASDKSKTRMLLWIAESMGADIEEPTGGEQQIVFEDSSYIVITPPEEITDEKTEA